MGYKWDTCRCFEFEALAIDFYGSSVEAELHLIAGSLLNIFAA
jgi:hypothetical protein